MVTPPQLAHAYGFASNVKPAELLHQLGVGEVVQLGKTHAFAREGGCRLFAFDFGALVFFGFEESQRDAVVAEALKRVGPEPHAPLRDDYRLIVDAAAA